jgi:hypothetical protein
MRRIPWTARAGMALLVAAIILFFGGKQWVETRTLRPLNIPISLDRGSISSTWSRAHDTKTFFNWWT